MEDIFESFDTILNQRLLDINSEKFDSLSKSALKLTTDELERESAYACGLTQLLCDSLNRCYDYFSQISDTIQSPEFESTPVEVPVSSSVLSISTNITRILRNLCCNNPNNQSIVVNSHVLYHLSLLCVNKHLWGAGEIDWSEQYELFIQISLQLTCNALIGNDEGKERVWSYYYPDAFITCLRQYSHHTKITEYCISLLYTCINQSNTYPLESLLSNSTLMTLLFSRSFQLLVTSCSFDWMDLLVYQIVLLISQSQQTSYLQLSLQSLATKDSTSSVTAEQLIYLHFLLDCLDSHTEIYLGDKNILYLCNWLIQCVEASKTLLMRNDHLIFDEDLLRMKDSQSMEIQKRLFVIECIEVVLAILSSQINGFSEDILSFIGTSKMFDILLAILAIPFLQIDTTQPTEVGELGEKKGTPMILQKEDVWNGGTRDSVLQILANLVYNHYEYQEKMRKMGGIELVLNHTKIHPKHPLQREWALFTIRNLCAGNEENQKYIDSFKVEGVASEPALEKLGVKVKMEDGKVKIEKYFVYSINN